MREGDKKIVEFFDKISLDLRKFLQELSYNVEAVIVYEIFDEETADFAVVFENLSEITNPFERSDFLYEISSQFFEPLEKNGLLSISLIGLTRAEAIERFPDHFEVDLSTLGRTA
jgi:hypothetical protein